MDSIKILVVDDESRMRKLISDFLGREGYIIVEAADGEEALEVFFREKGISLVILDVMMPVLGNAGDNAYRKGRRERRAYGL